MLNASPSLLNGAALGSAGSSKRVRLSAALTCYAITAGAIIRVGSRSLHCTSFFQAQTSAVLRAKRRLIASTTGTASTQSSISAYRPVRLSAILNISAQTVGQLRSQRRLSAVSSIGAATSVTTLRRKIRLSSLPLDCRAESVARLRNRVRLIASTTGTAVSVSNIRALSGADAPEERVLRLASEARVFFVYVAG